MKTISLVLTTYNNKENLERTLASIERQDYPAIELAIKDGGSTDGTLDVIKNYEMTSKHKVKWTTGKDKGIYDAMNQGYQMIRGDIVVFFNDLFQDGSVVSKMIHVIETHPECVGAYGDLVYVEDGKVVRYWKMGSQKSLYSGWAPGHPTLFLKREVYEKYGLYNPDYRIAADYEFMIRFLKDNRNRLAYLPETIIQMYYGGTSTSGIGSYIQSLKEVYRALKDNEVRGAFMIDVLRMFRVMVQFLKKERNMR